MSLRIEDAETMKTLPLKLKNLKLINEDKNITDNNLEKGIIYSIYFFQSEDWSLSNAFTAVAFFFFPCHSPYFLAPCRKRLLHLLLFG